MFAESNVKVKQGSDVNGNGELLIVSVNVDSLPCPFSISTPKNRKRFDQKANFPTN